MNNNPLVYCGTSIVFQEVPNEVTLAISIADCPHNCEGCHSAYLREYCGNYLLTDLAELIKEYEGMITCVCFMGGDHNIPEMIAALMTVNAYGLKTCLYSGQDDIRMLEDFIPMLNYLKVGSYNQDLGGLDSPTTNQVFYKIGLSGDLENINHLFQKRGGKSYGKE